MILRKKCDLLLPKLENLYFNSWKQNVYKAACRLSASSDKRQHLTAFWQAVFRFPSSYSPVTTIFWVFFQPLYLSPDQHQSLRSPVCWTSPHPQWLSVWYCAKSKQERKQGWHLNREWRVKRWQTSQRNPVEATSGRWRNPSRRARRRSPTSILLLCISLPM